MMDRRTFIGTVAGGLLAAPLAAGAQQAEKTYRIGSLVTEMPPTPPGQGLWYDRMRELGWVHGQNYIVERRAYGDQVERIPDLAVELMRSGVDMFIVSGSLVASRLQQVTRTIPIVASDAGDLVQSGLAASLARPGGNVTGVQTLQPEVVSKQLAFLKEALPGLSRVGVLTGGHDTSETDLRSPTLGPSIRTAETTGKRMGVRVQIMSVPRVEGLDAAFSAFRAGRGQGIILVMRTPFTSVHRKTIASLALKHRIPAISERPSFPRRTAA